ncbi:MAG: iron-sulfur cluster assembly accessory family protein [Gammaproteobacteria bacterium]|jgi:iron-sulfur cluster assembly accessory protein|nr:iron-sulfur cluster assembly accessory family protein [Gammaproteobacteria bacterium]
MVEKFNPNQVDITLTEAALKHFENFLKANPQAQALRFTVKKSGCSGFKYVTELANQLVDSDIDIANAKALKIVVDKANLAYLNGMIVDYISQNLGQSKLVFINPNEKNKCGCGESFSV